MELGIEGKVALVTGGTSGIGLAIARRLLREGGRVFVCGREPARLEEALGELRGDGEVQREVRGTLAHVDRPAEAGRLVEEAVAAFGRLDIVVSNAGTHLRGHCEELSPEQVEAHFRTKVLGPWELARHAAPHLRRQGGGRLILVIGQAGKVPGAAVLGSAVVNAAQHALVKSLSDDLGRDGILVNAVCPSRISSPLTADLVIDEERYLGRSLEQQESGWGDTVPLGRWGTPEDIADAVAFLASERASYLCGTNIDVDGGHQRMIF
ncbi:SDR family NAD(P)-dependent oxidoreductase [Azospirillum canadense]|uniref:SDR family NAD(P)-dependent oxidoreductase n=1 Tax=Azospirillum canadense TaxID=403962 RepID=UPI0022264061|nr:SDR family oxidoreductase [Azospirillum canadense]MCW2241149.1 NAD(P)-dependent dehydrogenase (short-subunit alcohol dehydrogenase family) [Azospirillum canadense]